MNVHFKIKNIKSNDLGIDIGGWNNCEEIILPLSEAVILPEKGQRIVLSGVNYNTCSTVINYDEKKINVFIERAFF